jgi:hypothetical protein
MLDRKREYPAAITSPSHTDQAALSHAITWIADQDSQAGGIALLYAPGKQNLQYDGRISRIAKAMTVATWRTLGNLRWTGGAVLALWPDREHLGTIAEDPRTRALCVIPNDGEEAEPWAKAVTAVRLGTAKGGTGAAISAPALADPVVVQGLLTLTLLVNHANNLVGASDHRDAVAVLQTLHDGGHELAPEQIYEWALINGWPSRGADRLRELAEKFAKGVRPRLNGPWPLRSDILATWRSEASGNVASPSEETQ